MNEPTALPFAPNWTLLAALVAALTMGCAAKSSDIAMHEGIVAQQRGDLSAAKLRYQRALKLEPTIKGAHTNLAAIALRQGETEAAMKELRAELAARAADPDAKLVRALVYLSTDRVDKALEDVSSIAQLGGGLPPDSVSGYIRRTTARVITATGRLMKAGSASSGEPVQAVWDALTPVLELDMKAVSAATQDASPAVIGRLQGYARRIGGLLALTSGNPKRGLELLQREQEVKKEQRFPLLRLHALVALGRHQEALDFAGSAEAGPLRDSPWAKVIRAHALVALGKHGEVPKLVSGLGESESLPAALRASALRLMAGTHARRGDWPKAVAATQLASTVLGAKDVPHDLWLDQAVALAHVGKLEEARRAVAGVLRDAPENKRARDLERLLK